ncbi:DinB family protein [Aporhodopirellula aestuarii]|uniref:DUF1572 domain-containing protein n=1 Tax=Aporhodopirellula aestuarii TaxID=2950107 RepID=A0ABT0UBS7_9BACT|nr:DinB family protein [Aporhodopirellula aestuarii]MCM2374240.1 DUF1572 domain-containing protein [Aporhodopirellula aestuarii]
MDSADSNRWQAAMWETVQAYRRMIDAITAQLTDDELFARPSANVNSVAIILRHLGGNLKSRWTDFLTTDGEKPDRDRDSEFLDWEGDRQSLIEHFESGWRAFESAVNAIDEDTAGKTIFIRGEAHSVAQALTRSITHLTYHVGQIAMIARMVHVGEWRWLTVAPGGSSEHNEKSWGTSASRSVFAADETGQNADR